ncbi:alcohol dehydrogenase [Aspergillus turcosus]|uniref:Alcohol dehydrogenase n=1 Tax=Aspergillus turcosus TaxID=1245748 RepID=A0A229Z4Q2_9EURO|nr:alcohol dehydrogenase [Aspergillus turcosus]RLL96128.1 alcohol dehydrogenase [Aspergillus turcosus]
MSNTVVKIINIKGSYVGNRQDAVEAIDFFARGLINAPLRDLPHIFELLAQSISHYIQDPSLTTLIEQGRIVGRYVLEVPE